MQLITEKLVATAAAADSSRDMVNPFDFILMDTHMPMLEGPEATHRIRQLGFTNPIIGVTGNLADVDIEHFVASGADAVLTKPLEMKKLDEVLQQHTMLRAP
jgi:CheY-like chemotaxis protein